jgi:hypothetical protein
VVLILKCSRDLLGKRVYVVSIFSGFLFRGSDFSFAFYLIDFVGIVIPHLKPRW